MPLTPVPLLLADAMSQSIHEPVFFFEVPRASRSYALILVFDDFWHVERGNNARAEGFEGRVHVCVDLALVFAAACEG